MRRYPLCWECNEEVDTNPIYEAICGHDDCPSAVFHGLCLMRWREHRDALLQAVERIIAEHPGIFRRGEQN